MNQSKTVIKKTELGKSDKTAEDDLYAKKPSSRMSFRDYLSALRFYYVPVFIIAAFLALAVFAVYPSMVDLINNYGKYNELKADVEAQDARIVKLKELENESASTEEYLTYIDKIAPIEKTNVADFQSTIKEVASNNRLTIKNSRGGEEIISDDTSTSSLQLIEVPINYTIVGPFANLKNFLSDIYKKDDFIIIQNMDFSRESESTNAWNMQITLVKYQFNVSDTQTETPDTNLVDVRLENFVPNEQVLEFLNEKYINPQS
jgi:Tfp pilus assembly protein PilO